MAVRRTMLDLALYENPEYKRELHRHVHGSLRMLAQVGGSALPLCVVAHGFGALLAIEVFGNLQNEPNDSLSLLERGHTLAYMATLGCPYPLALEGTAKKLEVPAPQMLERWPHLRGGWSNFYNTQDPIGLPLRSSNPSVSEDVESRRRCAAGESIQNVYFQDLTDCIDPVAHSLSCVWQDINRTHAAGDVKLD
mmetsp:Transcript_8106/g.19395  ORF Transcript_8106/g.19395 Transcript_8106/m.19395 type:complete len:194 (+) Transcript_8106:1988-2569(+)